MTRGLVDTLGTGIVQGEYARQAFPTEAELACRHGVSRTVAREAMKMLSAKGLVDTRPRQGPYVRSAADWNLFDPDILRWLVGGRPPILLVRQFGELRRAFEPEAAGLAAACILSGDPDPIGEALAAMRRARLGQGEPVGAEVAFHIALVDRSRNPFFRQFRTMLAAILPASIELMDQISGAPSDIRLHAAIHEAIGSRDPGSARRAMIRLLSSTVPVLE